MTSQNDNNGNGWKLATRGLAVLATLAAMGLLVTGPRANSSAINKNTEAINKTNDSVHQMRAMVGDLRVTVAELGQAVSINAERGRDLRDALRAVRERLRELESKD